MRTALVLSLLAITAFGCSKKSDAPAGPAGPAASAVAVTNAPIASGSAAATVAAAPTGSCKVDVAPFVIDKGARGETGVTLVRLPDDRLAVGYAAPDGSPRVAIVLPEGSATVVGVDASKLPEIAKGTKRVVHRVTPLVAKELKLRAAVDFVETRGDGTRLVRCGVADDEPLAKFEGKSAYDGAEDGGAPAGGDELRDCRSFGEAGKTWTLAFDAHDEGATVDARWRVHAAGTSDGSALLDHKAVPAETGHPHPRAAQLDRYGYTLMASTKLGDAGYLVASRYNGRIMLAKRSAAWAAEGDAGDYWLGAAIGMPSIAARDAKIVVLAPLAGKLDLYGATFPFEVKAPKPEKLAIAEPPGAAPLPEGAERTAVSASIAPHGRIVAAFLDGKAGKRHARVALFDEALKPRGAAFEALGPDADALDVKVLALDDDRLLVTALLTHTGGPVTVEGTILRCGAAAP